MRSLHVTLYLVSYIVFSILHKWCVVLDCGHLLGQMRGIFFTSLKTIAILSNKNNHSAYFQPKSHAEPKLNYCR